MGPCVTLYVDVNTRGKGCFFNHIWHKHPLRLNGDLNKVIKTYCGPKTCFSLMIHMLDMTIDTNIE